MHKFIDKIKKFESKPFVVKDFLNEKEINSFRKLYEELPVEIDNKRQKILKKKWSTNFNKELQNIYIQKLKAIISDFEMDNPETKNGLKSLGLFQESYKPVSLHVDTGFNFDKLIFKWTMGDLLVFDRSNLHCSSNNINKKKIGFTSSTIKL